VDSRKELAAAFRRINPASPFDVQRAHKWLQGRSLPRGTQIYEDWAKLVELGEPAEWIADCAAEHFLGRLCARHGLAPDPLRRRADAFGGITAARKAERCDLDLVGSYATYTHAWSSYFRGRLIRGTLSIAPDPGSPRLRGAYSEELPMGPMRLGGPVVRGERVVTAHLVGPQSGAQISLWLFAPAPPTSVLAGMMSGTSLMSAETQFAATRVILMRLPASVGATTAPACLPKGGSVAADLARSGLALDSPDQVDRAVAAFLGAGCPCLEQLTPATCRDVVERFDRHWLDLSDTAERHDRVVPFATADRR
jgi:hypothetical protein